MSSTQGETPTKDLGERSNRLLIVLALSAAIVGLFLAGLGVILVYLGATGNSKLNIFGSTVSSESVGIPAIFIGGVLVILVYRRILTSHDIIFEPLVSKGGGTSKEEQEVQNLFESVALAGDIFSEKYIPSLIDQIEHYQINKLPDEEIIIKLRASIKNVIDELNKTCSDFAPDSERPDPKDPSNMIPGIVGIGCGMLRNSLVALDKEIENGIKIGKPNSVIVLQAKQKLYKLAEKLI